MEQQVFTLFGTFLLAFARIASFFVQAPIYGSRHFPKQLLVGLAATMTIVLYPSLPVPKDFPTNFGNFFLSLLSQLTVGLILGYISYITMACFEFAGQVMDVQMGISIAATFDPALRGTSNMLRRMEFYIAMILYMMLGWHHQLIRGLYKSFEIIPLTGFNLSGDLTIELIYTAGQIFVIGLQIAGPVLAVLFIIQVALGMLARVAPQMNVFMMSFPLNIALGIAILKASFDFLPPVMNYLFDLNMQWFIQAMKLMGQKGGP